MWCTEIKEDALIVNKNEFVLFMVEVINWTAQTSSKTEKIKIIVNINNIKGLSWEVMKEVLAGETPNSQAWAGLVAPNYSTVECQKPHRKSLRNLCQNCLKNHM